MAEADELTQLITLRDWLRFAVSRFNAAGLVYGHGTATALDEAAFLILHTLHLPVDQLEPWMDCRLLMSERQALQQIIERRIATRKPAPYLTNQAWIQGQSFYVDERVIVPRSYIGELLAGDLEGIAPEPASVRSVLDLCTGSGCLAILAALRFEDAKVDASEISADALAVAGINVRDYRLEDRIELIRSDLFAGLGGRRYDLILCQSALRRCRGGRVLSAGICGGAETGPCGRRRRTRSGAQDSRRGPQSLDTQRHARRGNRPRARASARRVSQLAVSVAGYRGKRG